MWSFFLKCWDTFWVGFGWGGFDKAFDVESNHLPLLLLFQVGFVPWCAAKYGSCCCPAQSNLECSPFSFTGLTHLTRRLLSLLWVQVSLPHLAVLEGVNAVICLADVLLQSKMSEKWALLKSCFSVAHVQIVTRVLLPCGLSRVRVQPREKGRQKPRESVPSCLGQVFEIRFTHELIIILLKT